MKLANLEQAFADIEHPSQLRLYKIYQNMKWRCSSDSECVFKYYKRKGVRLCDEWKGENGFNNFYIWSIGNGYKDNLSIDRIDVNGDYCPQNCRWANWQMQANNKTTNHRITYKNETHTISEWSRILGIGKTTIRERLKRGWSVEKALSFPIQNTTVKKVYQTDKNGNIIKTWDNAADAAKALNVHRQSVYNCINGKRKTIKGFKFTHELEKNYDS